MQSGSQTVTVTIENCVIVNGNMENSTANDLPLQNLFLGPSVRYALLSYLSVLFLVGFCGNTLTLLALPYVRRNYGNQFSALQTSTTVLLLHRSCCDLLYIIVGFTHFIHVLVVGKARDVIISYIVATFADGDPFIHLGSPYRHRLCYAVALVRNWVGTANWTTVGTCF